MGPLAAGDVVIVRFPFSDLSQAKTRPAIVLADAGYTDWLLCQITSQRFGDPRAVPISDADFSRGSLILPSFARPAKLFTAEQTLISAFVGALKGASFIRVRDAVIQFLLASPTPP